MAINQSVNFSSPNSPDAQDYQIQQAQQLAQLLRTQAGQPIESAAQNAPISWTQGLQKLFEGYSAGQERRLVGKLLNQKNQQAEADVQAKINMLAPQAATTLDSIPGNAPPPLLANPDAGPTPDAAPATQLTSHLMQPNAVPGGPMVAAPSPQGRQLATLLAGMPSEAKNQFLTQALANRVLPAPQLPFELVKGAKHFNAAGQMDASNPEIIPGEHVSRNLAGDMVQEGIYNKNDPNPDTAYTWGAPHKGHEPATISMMNDPGSQASIASDAQLVASGKAPLPPFGGMGASGVRNGEVRKQALALNPSLDATTFTKRRAAENSFAASIDGRNLDSYNTIAQHIQFGQQAYQLLKNGDIQALNSLANSAGIQVGQAPAQTYRNIATFLGNETARATIGGQSGEEDRAKLSKMFSDALSPDQAGSAYNAAETLVGGRLMSVRKRFESAVQTYDTKQHKWTTDPDEFNSKLTPAAMDFESKAGSTVAAPHIFSNESEAASAAAAGKIKSGDKIVVGGQSGTWH